MTDLEVQVRKLLRVREPLAARQIAEKLEVSTNTVCSPLHNLVRGGLAVKHPGSTKRGDRAPRYTAPSKASPKPRSGVKAVSGAR